VTNHTSFVAGKIQADDLHLCTVREKYLYCTGNCHTALTPLSPLPSIAKHGQHRCVPPIHIVIHMGPMKMIQDQISSFMQCFQTQYVMDVPVGLVQRIHAVSVLVPPFPKTMPCTLSGLHDLIQFGIRGHVLIQ